VAALLEREGYNVKYYDAVEQGITNKVFIEEILSWRPDIILLYSVNLSADVDTQFVYKLNSEYAKKQQNNLNIIYLGPAPTYEPEKFLLDGNTYVVRGEPECTVLNLCNKLLREKQDKSDDYLHEIDIPGVSYKRNNKYYHNSAPNIIEDLDSLPFPARHLINRDRYYNPKFGLRPFTTLLTSRGCSYPCRFCVPCSLSFAREIEYRKDNKRKPPVRLRCPKNIINEFRMLANEGYRAISIIDDQFIWGEDRTGEICGGIRATKIKWGCLTRPDLITDKIAKYLADSGCVYVDLGVESFFQPILDDIGKKLSADCIPEAVRILKQYKIKVKLNIMFGASDKETEGTIIQTIRKVEEINPTAVMFGICSPFPGTLWYDDAKKNGWLRYDKYIPVDVQKVSMINYPHLPAIKLEALRRYANYRLFFSLSFILKNIRYICHPIELIKALKSLWLKLI